MPEPSALDRQLADMVWIMVTALRAGYRIQQILEQLAAHGPQPSAAACASVVADLRAGLPLAEALTRWQENAASAQLADIIAIILTCEEMGGNLANVLEPTGEEIYSQVGSDGACLPMMQALAKGVGAALPQRA